MKDSSLTQRELRRYSRQIILPGFGNESQEMLKAASVLVVGAGGIGCPVLQYITAAGVGRIGIADFDLVSEENLQRQILYGSADVGKLKSIIARSRLEELNSLVTIEIHNLRIDESNAINILGGYDVIVDATDNLESRYIINDACVILSKPMVHGAIFRFEGEVSVFNYRKGPTYRCYNPFRDKEDFRNPLPKDVGISGVLPGIAGTIMANEIIKIITGTGTVLSGKILLFNISESGFRQIIVKPVPENSRIAAVSGKHIITGN